MMSEVLKDTLLNTAYNKNVKRSILPFIQAAPKQTARLQVQRHLI